MDSISNPYTGVEAWFNDLYSWDGTTWRDLSDGEQYEGYDMYAEYLEDLGLV